MFACLHAPALPAASAALLVNCACGFSPRVEETGPQTVVLDIAGLDRLLGPAISIANAISRRAAELSITSIHIAIASNPDAAIHAARGFPGITLIPPGEESRVLAGLPLSILSPPPELAETLHAWGLRTFRDLAALPEAGLSERLGPEGLHLQQLARGSADRPLVPSLPPATFEASLELDDPVAQLEPLLFLLVRLLQDLLAQLQSHGLAANELRLHLQLDDRSTHARTFRLPFPMASHKTFLKLLQLDLESHPPRAAILAIALKAAAADPRIVQYGLFLPPLPEPEKLELTLGRIAKLVGAGNLGAPELLQLDLESHPPRAAILAITLEAAAADPRIVQYGLFLPPLPEPEKLELTLGRIAKLVGAKNIGAPELLDTHRPGAFRLKRFAPDDRSPAFHLQSLSPAPLAKLSGIHCPNAFRLPSLPRDDHSPAHHCPAIRLFRPPLPAQVEATSGEPRRLTARGLRGVIVSRAGPWRTSGDWWRDAPWSRDEWDVALANGPLCRIYLDHPTGLWFVEGEYD